MKKQYLLIGLTIFACRSFAQKYLPSIKPGSVLTYTATSRNTGQTAGVILTIINISDSVKMKWDIPFVGTGYFEMGTKSLLSATKTVTEEPEPDMVTKLDDDKTLVLISKTAYRSMVSNKTFMLNGYIFNVKTDTSSIIINNKPLNVTYATTLKGHREIWILNEPDFPLICRARRVTPIDFWLTDLKE